MRSAVWAALRAKFGIDLRPDAARGPLLSAHVLPVLVDPRRNRWSGGRGLGPFGDPTGPPLAAALALQMTRLAAESGLVRYPEVADVLVRLRRGERPAVDDESPFGIRLRTVVAEAGAAVRCDRDEEGARLVGAGELRAWRAQEYAVLALLGGLALPPEEASGAVLSLRKDPRWRAEFAADLAAAGAGGPAV